MWLRAAGRSLFREEDRIHAQDPGQRTDRCWVSWPFQVLEAADGFACYAGASRELAERQAGSLASGRESAQEPTGRARPRPSGERAPLGPRILMRTSRMTAGR